MQKNDLLFVYGTLRRGQRADLQKQAHQFGVTFCGEDLINGTMFHLGAYPGIKATAKEFEAHLPIVHGEVFRLREAGIGALMDAYEGYIPPEERTMDNLGLYDRIQTNTEKGRLVWVYTYLHPVTPDQRIESGDWVKNPDTPIRTRNLRI